MQFRLRENSFRSLNAMRSHRILQAPPVQPLESFSSWISRLTLSQGTTRIDMARHMGISLRGDVDWNNIFCEAKSVVLSQAGMAVDAFHQQDLLLKALHFAVPCERALLKSGSWARYRYCPSCLSQQLAPHFYIYWRIASWRNCPVHECPLYEGCLHCGNATTAPIDMLQVGLRRRGIVSLGKCAKCGRPLADVTTVQAKSSPSVCAKQRDALHCLSSLQTALVKAQPQGFQANWVRLRRLLHDIWDIDRFTQVRSAQARLTR